MIIFLLKARMSAFVAHQNVNYESLKICYKKSSAPCRIIGNVPHIQPNGNLSGMHYAEGQLVFDVRHRSTEHIRGDQTNRKATNYEIWKTRRLCVTKILKRISTKTSYVTNQSSALISIFSVFSIKNDEIGSRTKVNWIFLPIFWATN